MNIREFKFRVWDQDLKEFIEWTNDDPMIKCRTGDVYCWERKADLSGDDLVSGIRNVTVQQYTGLKDKNGVEIYEGDIIRGMMDFGPAGFHERSVIVKWDDKEGYQWNYFLLDTIKVEGNMFENPELLDLI